MLGDIHVLKRVDRAYYAKKERNLRNTTIMKRYSQNSSDLAPLSSKFPTWALFDSSLVSSLVRDFSSLSSSLPSLVSVYFSDCFHLTLPTFLSGPSPTSFPFPSPFYLVRMSHEPSTFLQLPSPIRKRIYLFAGLVSYKYTAYPYVEDCSKDGFKILDADYQVSAALLGVCKQVHDEV